MVDFNLENSVGKTLKPFTSSSFMTGTGLKKWSPANNCGRVVAIDMCFIDSDEVLLANSALLCNKHTKTLLLLLLHNNATASDISSYHSRLVKCQLVTNKYNN